MRWRTLLPAILILAVGAASTQARVFGDKKKGIKGRYLEVLPSVALNTYEGALVILPPAEIISDKDRPVDTESVRATSDQTLRDALQQSRLFGEILSTVPLELPEDQPILRLTTKLTLEHGSQAMRFWVGGGAGKSKLHIRIEIMDVRSGQQLGHFNGYGTGAGLWSMSGGGVQRMARDDLDESYQKFREYLVLAFQ